MFCSLINVGRISPDVTGAEVVRGSGGLEKLRVSKGRKSAMQRVATVSVFLTVGFSSAIPLRQAHIIDLNRTAPDLFFVQRKIVVARPSPFARLADQTLPHRIQMHVV